MIEHATSYGSLSLDGQILVAARAATSDPPQVQYKSLASSTEVDTLLVIQSHY